MDDINIDGIEVEVDLGDIDIDIDFTPTTTTTTTTSTTTPTKKPLSLKLSSPNANKISLLKIPNQTRKPLALTVVPNQNTQSQLTIFKNNYQSNNIPTEVTFQLISETQFSCMGCKNPIINSVFESIPNSHVETYDGVDWWIFNVDTHSELYDKLKNIPKITLTTLPMHILTSFTKYNEKIEKLENQQVDLTRLGTKLLNTLLPFQRLGIEFGIKREGRVLIADEMGLGKTIQALSIAYYYKDEWPLLIIAPSSLKLAWNDQIKKFLSPTVDEDDVNIIMNGKCGLNGLINIISYDLVAKKQQEIINKQFKVVIADESHFVKHFVTKRTKSVIPILQTSKRTILLTGTPALSKPSELFTQINSIRPWFQKWQSYGLRYCAGYADKYGMNYNGHSNLRELNLFLHTFMIRRRKDEVLTELPDKRREVINIPLDKKSLKKIKQTLDEIKKAKSNQANALDKRASNSAKGTKNSLFMKLFRDTGLYKLASIKKLLSDRIESIEGKFIIFAHHTNVIDGLCEFLNELNLEYIKIDGRTKIHARNEYVEMFQNKESTIRVAVLSITAAGTGLTLTEANLVIFAELFWNPGTLLQAEDRAHRYGQTKSVLVQYLIGLGTVDETIWSFIDSKLNCLGQVLDGEQGHDMGVENSNINIDITDPSMDEYIFQVIQRVEEDDKLRKIKMDKVAERKRLKLLNQNEGINQVEEEEEDSFEEEEEEEEIVNTKNTKQSTMSNSNKSKNTKTIDKSNLKRKETTEISESIKKRKVNVNSSNHTTSPLINPSSIEVNLEEDFEDLIHVDISKFSASVDKDEESLDSFLFQPSRK